MAEVNATTTTTTIAPTISPTTAAPFLSGMGTNSPTTAPFVVGSGDDVTPPTITTTTTTTNETNADSSSGPSTTTTTTTTTTTDEEEDGETSSSTTILWPLILLVVLITSLVVLLASIIGLDTRPRKHNTRLRNKLIGTILFIAVGLSVGTHGSCAMWRLIPTTTTMSSDEWYSEYGSSNNDIQAIGVWGVWNEYESCEYGASTSHHTTTARVMAVFATLAGAVAFLLWMASPNDTKPKFLASVSMTFVIAAICFEAGAITALFRSLPCRQKKNNDDNNNDIYDCTMWGSYNTATLGGTWPILALTYWSTGAAVILYTIVKLEDDAIRPTDE